MQAVEKIRKALKTSGYYPEGVANTCRIYKDHNGWQICQIGKTPWAAGGTVIEAIDRIREMAEIRNY